MNPLHSAFWLAAYGSVLALLAACGGGSEGGALPPPPASVPAPPTSVTQTVGSQGGTIAGPNGIVLTVPADALAVDTSITIAVDAAGAPPLPANGRLLAPLVSLTPHGTSFGVPVSVSMPFDPGQLPSGQRAFLIKTNSRGDGWQQLVTEHDGNTLSAAATAFSWIGVACCYDPVHIVDQPDDQTAFEGGFAFFRVEAFGFAPNDTAIRYQWFRDGLLLLGETNPEILIPRVTLAHDNSLYMARVTGFGGIFEDSRAARLLVQPAAPRIVNEPLDLEVVAGQRASFTAASTSSVVQTLQWERTTNNDSDFSGIAGETATQLSFVAQDRDHNRRYRMCATNGGGMTCSRGARLSVLPQPVQPVIAQQPQAVVALAGTSASFTVLATGGSLAYEWQSARAGASFAPEPRCGDSATCTISNVALADDGTQFRVRVFNPVGSVLSSEALLTVRLNPGAVLVRVVAGGSYSIGLRASGALRAWGGNTHGQLGDGTFDVRSDAVDVVAIAGVATLSAGFSHALAIRGNGEVWAWGRNQEGQLGDGTTIHRATPQPVPGLAPARAVAASVDSVNGFSLAVLADGKVRAWGDNDYGQLGDGTVTARINPVQVGSLTDVAAVSAGWRHALALRRDGTVWAWGANNVGQLGNGTTTASTVPIPVLMPAPIVAIAAGGLFSLALTDQGTLLAWGFNIAGELGDGTTERRLAPVTVTLPAPAVAIAASWGAHALALLADGRVFAWGFNEYGQCGLGTDTPFESMPQAVIAPLPADIVAIGVGANHSLALDGSGNVWTWGNNSGGRLNDGTAAPQRETPVMVRNVNLN
jgi:alpha-tubulin suppressor-like RCC1 family protein